MLTFISNTRSVSASGSVQTNSSSLPQGFQCSNGLSNLLDDCNWQANGTAAIAGSGLSASATAAQTSALSPSAISMSGKLLTQTQSPLAATGCTTSSLAASVFEVTFSLDVATNFTLTGTHSFASLRHTNELVLFSFSALGGTPLATVNDLNGTAKPLTLLAGTYIIKFDTQVGAKTDPNGDLGQYIYSFSLVAAQTGVAPSHVHISISTAGR
jgi:hypothetical protein